MISAGNKSRFSAWNTIGKASLRDWRHASYGIQIAQIMMECCGLKNETVIDGSLKHPGTLCEAQYMLGLTCREKDFEYQIVGVALDTLVENHTHEPTAPRPGNKGNTAAQQQRISGESDKSVRSNYGTVSNGRSAMDKTLFG